MRIKEIIQSRNNPLVKWVSTLADKKGRAASGSFIAEGVKLTVEALTSSAIVTHVLIAESKFELIKKEIEEKIDSRIEDAPEVYILSDSAFEKISTERAPQGVISVIKYLDFFSNISIIYKEEFFLKDEELALALFSVRDPSNLGAVIRSAVAFGIEHIVLSADCADPYNPKAVRAAMGCLFKVKITRVEDFTGFIVALRNNNRRAYAAELSPGSIALNDVKLHASDVFVIGNEGHGISSEVSSLCTDSVYIPISAKAESLNASVAASILLWEISKAR